MLIVKSLRLRSASTRWYSPYQPQVFGSRRFQKAVRSFVTERIARANPDHSWQAIGIMRLFTTEHQRQSIQSGDNRSFSVKSTIFKSFEGNKTPHCVKLGGVTASMTDSTCDPLDLKLECNIQIANLYPNCQIFVLNLSSHLKVIFYIALHGVLLHCLIWFQLLPFSSVFKQCK